MNRSFPKLFAPEELHIVNDAVAMAEELVHNAYKMSASQWLRLNYDVGTTADLLPDEIVDGPFAQVIRYEERRSGLGSGNYDFYKICLQDPAILNLIRRKNFPLSFFCVYVVAHELIHIVRFRKFLQNFEASPMEKLAEEKRVHEKTHEILKNVQAYGKDKILLYFGNWRKSVERLGGGAFSCAPLKKK